MTPATPATTPRPSRGPLAAAALELTLAPVATEAFLAANWDTRPLLVERGESGRFGGVLSTAMAEALVCSSAVRAPGFRLIRDGAQLPLSTYTRDVPWRPGSFSGMPVVEQIAREFESGATLVLQALHLYSHGAAVYCRGLEAALGCHAQANAYWTPAGAQGFAVHHDTHDVFVLQVAGRKRWRIYEPLVELPLSHQRWKAHQGDVGSPVMDFHLAPGDSLYIPRGWPHQAETSEQASLHVTVGLHPPTRLAALRAALNEAADEDVELRRALDGDLSDDLLARVDVSDLVARARRRFVMSRRPILDGQLSEIQAIASLTVSTAMRRRETVIADLEDSTLVFEGKEVTFPPAATVALAAIHAAFDPFSADELPGGLDDAGRLVLIRRLVREGYLRRA